MTMSFRSRIAAACVLCFAFGAASAQTVPGPGNSNGNGADNGKGPPAEVVQFVINQSRGADHRVRYAELVKHGPWDDRNYRLRQEDLALLSPNEHEAQVPIPAFYRVQMRKANPNLPT